MKFVKNSSLLSLAVAILGSTDFIFASDDEYHGIHIFECDNQLNELSTENRQVKNPGTAFRICFKPYDSAKSRIKKIESFTWETSYDGGSAKMTAIENGEGNGYTTELACKNKGKICYLDTFLPSDFHKNEGSVIGLGNAKLQIKEESSNGSEEKTFRTIDVELAKDVFQHSFNLVLKDGPDGEELSAEEAKKLKDALAKQQSEMVGEL